MFPEKISAEIEFRKIDPCCPKWRPSPANHTDTNIRWRDTPEKSGKTNVNNIFEHIGCMAKLPIVRGILSFREEGRPDKKTHFWTQQ
jgi:hypothetical protein